MLNLNSVELKAKTSAAFEHANEYFVSSFQWEQILDDLEGLWFILKPYIAKLLRLTWLSVVMVAYAAVYLVALANEKLEQRRKLTQASEEFLAKVAAPEEEEFVTQSSEEVLVVTADSDAGKSHSECLSNLVNAVAAAGGEITVVESDRASKFEIALDENTDKVPAMFLEGELQSLNVHGVEIDINDPAPAKKRTANKGRKRAAELVIPVDEI